MNRVRALGLSLCLLLALTACDQILPGDTAPEPIATLASFETLPTALFLTANAPPPGFGLVQFDPVDRTLADHPGWAYTLEGVFTGTADGSGDPVTGRLDVRVLANELGQARRVVLEVEGLAFLPDEALLSMEGVRISDDYFAVDVNGRCTADQGGAVGSAATIADLDASQVIGGARDAAPTGHRAVIAGLDAWQYAFPPETLSIPAVHRLPASQVAAQADLWIAPAVNAVLRYTVTADVAGVYLLWADQAASSPVSGRLELTYELDVPALDQQPNITIPHGC